jgi:hypothetical protein
MVLHLFSRTLFRLLTLCVSSAVFEHCVMEWRF